MPTHTHRTSSRKGRGSARLTSKISHSAATVTTTSTRPSAARARPIRQRTPRRRRCGKPIASGKTASTPVVLRTIHDPRTAQSCSRSASTVAGPTRDAARLATAAAAASAPRVRTAVIPSGGSSPNPTRSGAHRASSHASTSAWSTALPAMPRASGRLAPVAKLTPHDAAASRAASTASHRLPRWAASHTPAMPAAGQTSASSVPGRIVWRPTRAARVNARAESALVRTAPRGLESTSER